VQACWLEVDVDSGVVTLLKHWCVEDCGQIINPLLVDEQVRGGIVQDRRGALRALRLLARGPAAGQLHGRLPECRWRRRCRTSESATSRRRRGVAAGGQRRGRGRHRRRTGCRHERHQRRAEAFRRQGVRPAFHARAHPCRTRQGACALAGRVTCGIAIRSNTCAAASSSGSAGAGRGEIAEPPRPLFGRR
jgi:hypothetical protein